MNRLPTCALALGLFGAGLTAQAWTSDRLLTDSTETTVVQVSGLVVTGDSLSPLPYCTVYRARDRRGTMTDVRGFFSLPALEGDTLEFSSVGYVTHRAIIPEGSEMGRVNLVQPMGRDTVNMAVVANGPSRSRVRAFSVSDIGGALGDSGQNHINVLNLARGLGDGPLPESIVFGCGQ